MKMILNPLTGMFDFVGSVEGTTPAVPTNAILTEDGDYLMTENGFYLVLEDANG